MTERVKHGANYDRNLNFLDDAFPLLRAIQLDPVFQFFAKSKIYELRKVQKSSKAKFANIFQHVKYHE
jgi:7,8-dihydro-6-hydroxymethylpterin-pyrophosphokinase